MATRLNPSNFGYQNFYSSTLTGDITSGTLTIGLATVPTPSSGILVIEPDSTSNREVIVYTSKGASTITCPSDGRGYSGSTPAAHLTGSTVIMAPVDKWFTALASGELSTDPLRTEIFFDHINSGMVWSGDAYASTRNASMTSGVVYINGRRLTAAAVSARSFTASKDTYIDASDNGDGTVLLTYTEVANNAASPALAANSVRIGIIVTGASSIATAGSVNQGQEDSLLPITSSTPYATVDSLGNIICPRDPNRNILGQRRAVTTQTISASGVTNLTSLSVPVIVPSNNRKIKITAYVPYATTGAANNAVNVRIAENTTVLNQIRNNIDLGKTTGPHDVTHVFTPTAGLHTYIISVSQDVAAGVDYLMGSTFPGFILVELV